MTRRLLLERVLHRFAREVESLGRRLLIATIIFQRNSASSLPGRPLASLARLLPPRAHAHSRSLSPSSRRNQVLLVLRQERLRLSYLLRLCYCPRQRRSEGEVSNRRASRFEPRSQCWQEKTLS